jgi:hypothetical protein
LRLKPDNMTGRKRGETGGGGDEGMKKEREGRGVLYREQSRPAGQWAVQILMTGMGNAV